MGRASYTFGGDATCVEKDTYARASGRCIRAGAVRADNAFATSVVHVEGGKERLSNVPLSMHPSIPALQSIYLVGIVTRDAVMYAEEEGWIRRPDERGSGTHRCPVPLRL